MTEQPTKPNRNQGLIDSMRAAADYLESHPLDKEFMPSAFYLFAHDPEEFRTLASQLGSARKFTDPNFFNLEHCVGELKFQLCVRRELVCEKVITQRVIPAKPQKVIPSCVIPARPERIEEISEWVCPESILRAGDPDEDGEDDTVTVPEPQQEPAPV